MGGRGKSVTQHDSIAVIDRLEKVQMARDWDQFANLHAESVVQFAPDRAEPRKGRSDLVKFYRTFFDAFPDMDAKRERAFAQGEWVCAEYTVTGTHLKPLANPAGPPIPPTNKKVRVASCTVYRVQGGKVVEVHEYFDQLGFLAQLGLAP
ncbi:MAG TPA: ester cyclase [Thermoplasmata archaeon]|nr:ester cyclase [Thermoplasmata archaeon]HLF05718.1 ester cyclase [Thermoplasmata archaeon]